MMAVWRLIVARVNRDAAMMAAAEEEDDDDDSDSEYHSISSSDAR